MTGALEYTRSIVTRIQRQGVTVKVVNLYAGEPDYMTLTVMLDDESRTPEMAAMLGLKVRGVQPYKDHAIQAFAGVVYGIDVTMQHEVPASTIPAAVTR